LPIFSTVLQAGNIALQLLIAFALQIIHFALHENRAAPAFAFSPAAPAAGGVARAGLHP
jgi:hypothetical protein